MNLEDTAEINPQPERLRFIEYKGRDIFLLDLTNCNPKEMLLLLDQIKAAVEQHERGSLLILADFTGTPIDKQVATRAKEVLVRDRPYVKKAAWVGTEHLPQVFYQNFKTFSQRELPRFKTREEALAWLAGE
jgi:hypothetical protein